MVVLLGEHLVAWMESCSADSTVSEMVDRTVAAMVALMAAA